MLNNQTQTEINQNNPLSILAQLKSSQNPQQIISQLPQYQATLQYINQNGGDAKTAFYNACSQKGINPNDILNQIR